jgi:hypothetical protein
MNAKNLMSAMITVLSLFLWLVAAAMPATSTATQSITISVAEVAEMTVSGDPAPLIVRKAATGSASYTVIDNNTVLSWTSNANSPGAGNRKITAQLDANFPEGIQLKASIGNPLCGTGSPTGKQSISIIAKELYAGIGNENCSGATINFEASLTQTTVTASEVRTLTWTLTEDR